MRIEPLRNGEWTRFLDLAIEENWMVPKVERALFQNGWRNHMFTLHAFGRVCGFVSAVPHQQGGWIGNLIVDPEFRGKGYGTILFDHAVSRLEQHGCQDIWLTASPMGRPLYEKKGFEVVDRVSRWMLTGECGLSGSLDLPADGLELLCRQDRRAWADCRRELIHVLARQGTVIGKGLSVALLQAGMERRVLGPWVSDHANPDENRWILECLAGMVVNGGEIISDIIESSGMEQLLQEFGFHRQGGADLMLRSAYGRGRPEGVVALASLGSIG